MLAATAPLEAVPDSEKDWHPGSNGLVFNLVHPSLYTIVYGRTIGKGPDSETASMLSPPELEDDVSPKFVSQRFQWIPSDFSVGGDGKVTLTSPYINNIHPTRHKDLYSIIPEILQHALPMFERVLSDLLRPLLPMRVATSGTRGLGDAGAITSGDAWAIGCIWAKGIPYPSPSEESYANHSFRTPDAKGKYDGNLQAMNNRISLKGRTLQMFVRLANIVLTPERPEYPGGKWHVDGSQLCFARNDLY